jgi:hypothetical protein
VMPEPEDLEHSIPQMLAAIGIVFAEQGQNDLAQLIANATISVEQTSSDNWNGGTYGYTVQLRTSPRRFAELGDSVGSLEEDLKKRLGQFARAYPNEFIEAVIVTPHISASTLPVIAAPSFWTEGALRVFLSHSSEYRAETAELAGLLAPYGVSAFVAHDHIEATKAWEDEIRLALSTCDVLSCLLTGDFHQSDWTDHEVGYAIGLGKLVVPIELGRVPYGLMGRYQALQARSLSRGEVALALVRVLAKHESTRLKMASALVTSFEQSSSFAVAKARVENLALIAAWPVHLVERVERAITSNSQIADAYHVPQRARGIVGRNRAGNA